MVLKELVWKITGDSSSAVRAANQADQAGQKAGRGFSKLKVGALAAAAAVVGFGVALGKMVNNQLKVIDDQAKMADRLGITTEAMAGLEHVAGLTGVTSEKLGRSIQSLERRIGDANEGVGRAGEAVGSLGLSMEEVTDLEADERFFEVAEALQGVEDRTEQARIANDLFGQQGRELLGVIRESGSELRDLSDEAKEFGTALSRDVAREAERFNDTMFRLSQRSEGVKRQFTAEMLPSLNRLGDAFFQSSDEGGAFNIVMESITSAVGSVIDGVAWLIEELNLFTGSASEVATLTRQIEILEDQVENTGVESERFWRRFVAATAAASDATGAAYAQETMQREELRDSRHEEIAALKEKLEEAKKEEDAERKRRDKQREAQRAAREAEREAAQEARDNAQKQQEEERKTNEELQRRIEIVNQINQTMQQGMAVISALGQLSAAQNRAKLERLDHEKEAELEKLGLLEETQIEQAERELEAAIEQNDKVAIAEKKRQLEKAKVEDKYRKERMKLEYQAEKDAYNWRVMEAKAQVPMAIMAGLTSGWSAGFPLASIMGPLYASLAGAAAMVQLQATQAAKPQPPKFATGGIVPGNTFSGDQVAAQLDSGEMVLNRQQQKQLFKMANGKGRGSNQRIIINLGGETLYDQIHKATENGELLIDARAVI